MQDPWDLLQTVLYHNVPGADNLILSSTRLSEGRLAELI